jgi:hypothetical protein
MASQKSQKIPRIRHPHTDVEDNIVKCQFDNIIGDFLGYTPALDDLVDQSRCTLGNLVNGGRVRWVEALQVLLLDAGGEELLVRSDFSRAALDLLGWASGSTILSLGRIAGLAAILAWRRLSWLALRE